jgi:hypothetical protein
MDEQYEQLKRLVFRDEAFELLKQERIPIGRGTFDKLCAPAENAGPPVAAWLKHRRNPRPMYEPQEILSWGRDWLRKRIKPAQAMPI